MHYELLYESYKPRPLKAFVVRDPKTRKSHKSDFRDRIVHHAIINIIEPHFEKSFINDSCANRIGKGTSYALKRFGKFQRKVTKNLTKEAYCLKADIKKYFHNINHEILIEVLKRKIRDKQVTDLIKKIVANSRTQREREREITKGMPLGNLTSQFFGNVYLNELDYFVKHKLKAKYYIRYVDDFVLLSESREQLEKWMQNIKDFLAQTLKLKLYPQKSKIQSLSNGIDFIGFRNFYNFNLLRKRNIKKMRLKLRLFSSEKVSYKEIMESFQGWQAYAKWANTHKLRKEIVKEIYKIRKSRPISENLEKYFH